MESLCVFPLELHRTGQYVEVSIVKILTMRSEVTPQKYLLQQYTAKPPA